MDTRRHVSAALLLALAAQLFGHAEAQGLTPYFESAGTEQKPRSNAGVAMQSDWLRLRADVALRAAQSASPSHGLQRRPVASTEVVPNLRSAFMLAKNLDLETRVNFAEWNSDTAATFDTRLRYRKSLDTFFDVLDGSLSRTPDGLTKQTLRLGFDEVLGSANDIVPLKISGEAILEATQSATLPGLSGDSQKVGVQTRVAGLASPFMAAENALSLKLEKTIGRNPQSASAVAYEQSWTLNPLTQLGLDLKFIRETFSPADDFEPSINLTWHSEF